MENNSIHSKISHISVRRNDSILFTLKKMDEARKKLLLVFDADKFYSLISIGDIQRAIINNLDLNSPIADIVRKDYIIANQAETRKSLRKKMLEIRAEFMPILNEKDELVDILFWEDILPETKKRLRHNLNLPVVIMAGGEGSRLKPLTNVIPKPLIPLGDSTIIEKIMENFQNYGCNKYYLSLNYKAETIKHYFKQNKNLGDEIHYFQENKPLGTAGSLFLIKDKIQTTFFVSNCDIIIEEDYSEILKYHRENNNELTIVSALKYYPIPYGTIQTGKDGILFKLIEKPELTFQINTGMYILEPHLLEEIPPNKFFHITQLIENIIQREGKVGVFPVSEGSWLDIGTMDEYLREIIK